MTSGANFIDDPRKWRVSKSGFSIRTGWNEDKTIIARYPGASSRLDNEHFQKWLEVAWSICELYNATLPSETTALASPAALRDEAELVDEVQHRMDQVVEAAVEWHQTGQEGGKWMDAADRLGAAINSLLDLRGDPNNMPRRWCSVHNREEFKYESLEHELHARQAGECFCGVDLEAGLCPNGHDPATSSATTPPSTPAKAAKQIADEYYFNNEDTKANWKGREQVVYDEITAIIERCISGGGEDK